MPAPRPEYVTERLGPLAKPAGTIDREKGVVYGVRVVTRVSANKRVYPVPVLRRFAAAYEGRVVNVGHRKRPDDYDDPLVKFGELRNVTADDEGLKGDLHFNPKHGFAEPFLWACEHNPGLYALSHHALVRWAPALDSDGRKVAESIDAVASVDIVSVGGTTSGVFESDQSGAPMTPEEVAATVTDAASLDTWLAAFFAALTLDPAAKQAAVETLMGSMAAAEPTDPAAAMESLRRLGGAGKWAAGKLDGYWTKEAAETARAKAVALCKAEGLADGQVSAVFLEMVTEAKSDDRAKAMIQERKALLANKTPAKTTAGGTGPARSIKDVVADLDLS